MSKKFFLLIMLLGIFYKSFSMQPNTNVAFSKTVSIDVLKNHIIKFACSDLRDFVKLASINKSFKKIIHDFVGENTIPLSFEFSIYELKKLSKKLALFLKHSIFEKCKKINTNIYIIEYIFPNKTKLITINTSEKNSLKKIMEKIIYAEQCGHKELKYSEVMCLSSLIGCPIATIITLITFSLEGMVCLFGINELCPNKPIPLIVLSVEFFTTLLCLASLVFSLKAVDASDYDQTHKFSPYRAIKALKNIFRNYKKASLKEEMFHM